MDIQGVPKPPARIGFFVISRQPAFRLLKKNSSPEHWGPYANYAYKTVSVRFLGAEMFAKQNEILD